MSETKRRADRIVEPKIDKAMRALALEGHGRLVKMTPRRTGRAAGNWNVSRNRPDMSVDMGATSADIGPKASKGQAMIAKTRFSDGDSLFVVNSLPYIEPIWQHGHSGQLEAGAFDAFVHFLRTWARSAIPGIARRG